MMSLEERDRLWAQLQQLGASREVVLLETPIPQVSDHAVLRFRERVERLPQRRARLRLEGLVSAADWQGLPRNWIPIVLHPGTHYGYPVARPDVCLLERDGFVVTVLSQRFLRQGSHYSAGGC